MNPKVVMRKLVGAVGLVLVLAGGAGADCGFVLWDSVRLDKENGKKESLGIHPVKTLSTLAECEAERDRFYALGRGDREWSGRDTTVRTFVCFPGAIDPRAGR
jgi:hypothetical protein